MQRFRLSVLVSACLVMAASGVADERLSVTIDTKTRVYHTPDCPAIGSHIEASTLKAASEQFKACRVCCPVCVSARQDKEAATLAATQAAIITTRKALTEALDGLTKSVSPIPTTDKAATSALAPAASSSGGDVHVQGYRRKDGTYVKPHTRKRPKS